MRGNSGLLHEMHAARGGIRSDRRDVRDWCTRVFKGLIFRKPNRLRDSADRVVAYTGLAYPLYLLANAIVAERSTAKNDGMLNPTSTAVKAVFGTSNATLDIRGNVMKAKITPTFATVTSAEMRVIVKQVNDYRRANGISCESAALKTRAQVALLKKQAGRTT